MFFWHCKGLSLLISNFCSMQFIMSLVIYIVFQHISLLHIGIRILCSMLSWVLVSSEMVGKCQTLTYLKFLQMCRAVGPEPDIVVYALSVDVPSTTLFISNNLGILTQPTVPGLMKDHFTRLHKWISINSSYFCLFYTFNYFHYA